MKQSILFLMVMGLMSVRAQFRQQQMMKKIIIGWLFCLVTGYTFGQDFCMYLMEEKVCYEISATKMLVKLENPDAYDFEKELQNTVAGSVINILPLSDGVFLIEMQQTDKDHLLELMQQWRAKEYVLSVSPIFIDEYGDEGGGYTNMVTVRLKSTDDYPVLQKCVEAYRITDIEPAPFDELEYRLTLPRNTEKTALDIANELCETELFEFADPACVLFALLGGSNRNPDQWNGENPFTVYPNPASDVLYIDIAVDNPACEINIYSLQGGKALQTATNGNKATIDVSVLPNGIYLLHLYNLSSGKREVRKIVIKH